LTSPRRARSLQKVSREECAMTEPAQAAPTAKAEDPLAELNARRAKYGVAYAIFAEGMSGDGMNRAVLVAKVVIGGIAAYALISAVLTGVGG